jgi:hypothetical protein
VAGKRRRRPATTESILGKRVSHTWLQLRGRAVRLLSDDPGVEARHQRFVLDVGGGQTVLVAHNLDLSERVPLGLGDRVDARGFYEWNHFGGTLHWTHRNPMGDGEDGYIRYRGRSYD